MKIAIHPNEINDFFQKGWIEYCEKNNIPHKIVNCYENNIIDQLKDCDVLMWHFSNYDYRDLLFAKQLLYSVKKMGKLVFPDFNTCWHFDDKVGQKYLLEAISAPLIPSYVFYNKIDAYNWINKTSFPKVFKLRNGSGSNNVVLVKNKKQARQLTKKSFSNGFSFYNRRSAFVDRCVRVINGKESKIGLLKAIYRLFFVSPKIKLASRQKGYIYFQDFIQNDGYDVRVVIISERAFALKRLVRENDFRASGSGNIIYDQNAIDISCIRIAFEVAEKLDTQCLTFDFIIHKNSGKHYIGEISYGFAARAYDKCPGYWDKKLVFHKESVCLDEYIIDTLIERKNKII